MALGNVSADCSQCRDMVIMKGGVECVTRIITVNDDSALVEIGCWVLCSLCRGDPLPKYELVKNIIPVLGGMIVNGIKSISVLSGCLWSLSYHT